MSTAIIIMPTWFYEHKWISDSKLSLGANEYLYGALQ